LRSDGGLFMPAEIARHSPEELEEFAAATVYGKFVSACAAVCTPDVPEEVLWQVVSEAINFPVNLVSLSPGLHILELVSRADAGVQDSARASWRAGWVIFVRGENAAADAGGDIRRHRQRRGAWFPARAGNSRRDLYPSKRISEAQEKQFSLRSAKTFTALEVAGTFDDCQRLGEAGVFRCGAEQACVADVREFHQYRAAAAADVLSRGGIPASCRWPPVPLIVSCPREVRQPYGESSPNASVCR